MARAVVPTENLIRSVQRTVDELHRQLADLLELIEKSRATIEESERRIKESEALIRQIRSAWGDGHEGEQAGYGNS
jgi:peptidoglycan hydrolase CwlO-like protein